MLYKTRVVIVCAVTLLTVIPCYSRQQESASPDAVLARPGLFHSLTEPPCSYCSSQNKKGLIRPEDRVIAWVRGVHNGGAVPIRLFLSRPRVVNDTYGLFFYDPDGDYVAAYKKDRGYEFYGWRRGVMVVKGPDGSLWSALTGTAFEGPQKGRHLERIPSLITDWNYWIMLHPESTTYDLFDGKRYPPAVLPRTIAAEAKKTMGQVDARLKPNTMVAGVEISNEVRAYPLDGLQERACILDKVGGEPVAVLWYGPSKTAVAYSCRLDDRVLTLYADKDSPETAPFKDRETGTRWTVAGRAVDGPLKGKELTWAPGIQCRWYAWAAEHPTTGVYSEKTVTRLHAVLMSESQATSAALTAARRDGFDSLVLNIDDSDTSGATREAAKRAQHAGLALYYWIEVGRNPAMADAHPQWMASLQGHQEWRRFFPGTRSPGEGEVVKNYPWVPVMYEETLAAHTLRIARLLAARPIAAGIFLNDLQAAPSACGCGNSFCRWTPDYGPIKTATRLPANAAARFVDDVQKLSPRSTIIPVWTTECEEPDMAKDGRCAGVPCFANNCWYEYTSQLMPVADECSTLAVLTPFRAFERDSSRYGPRANWVKQAIASFADMPPKRKGSAIPAGRILAVLQGWDVDSEDVAAQIQRAGEAGAAGYIVARMKIDQSWEPRIVKAVPIAGLQAPTNTDHTAHHHTAARVSLAK